MKTSSFLLIACVCLFFSCQKDLTDPGRNIGALHLSKEKPVPGDVVELTYRPNVTSDGDEVEGFYHYFVGSTSYPEDVELVDSAGLLKGQIIIPDSATALAFNFSRNGVIDNNFKKDLWCNFMMIKENSSPEVVPVPDTSTIAWVVNMK